MYTVLLYLLSLSYASTEDMRSIKDKTYTRDSSVCYFGKDKIQIQVRSESQQTEPQDQHYGSYIFYYIKEKARLLPLNQDKLASFRFFEANNSICSKNHAYPIDKDMIALLFLKENRPYRDKLTIQLFNSKTFEPGKVIETNYLTEEAGPLEKGFIFNAFNDRSGIEMGKIMINRIEFTYQDRDFPVWMEYTKEGFSISPAETFNHFQMKHYFKSKADFLKAAEWNEKEKRFKNTVLYVAVNHLLKKECLLFAPPHFKVVNNAREWNCLM